MSIDEANGLLLLAAGDQVVGMVWWFYEHDKIVSHS